MARSSSRSTSKQNFWTTILWAGFIAGTLDILSAFVQSYIRTGNNPLRILNYIAGVAFGKARQDEAMMPYYGLLIHFIIAYSFTLLFFLLYPGLKMLLKSKFLIAFLYGLFAWTVMNLVVVPIAKSSKIVFTTQSIIGMLILIVMIGLPLSLIADKYYSGKKTT